MIINKEILDILVRKINNKEINYKTNKPFEITDILKREYQPHIWYCLHKIIESEGGYE